MRPETPDAFLSGLYDKVRDLAIGSLANARRNLTKTRVSASDFIDILESQKLIELAKRAEKHYQEPRPFTVPGQLTFLFCQP